MNKKLTFGICAPSSYARREKFDLGVQKLRDLGHPLVIHPQAYGRLGETQLAGTVDERLGALYDLVQNPDVDAVLFACGGNGALHLLDQLDFDLIAVHPKPIIGFSDATILLNAISARTGQTTYHGPMAGSFGYPHDPRNHPDLMGLLDGTRKVIPLDGTRGAFDHAVTGRLYGGNLPCFGSLIGTPYLPDINGAILFFEDLGTELSHLDRTLCSMKLAGLFDRAAALIFGGFTDMIDTGRPFGFTVDQIIAAHTAGLNKPIITNAPFGHISYNTTLPIGTMVTLDARANGIPTLRLEK